MTRTAALRRFLPLVLAALLVAGTAVTMHLLHGDPPRTREASAYRVVSLELAPRGVSYIGKFQWFEMRDEGRLHTVQELDVSEYR